MHLGRSFATSAPRSLAGFLIALSALICRRAMIAVSISAIAAFLAIDVLAATWQAPVASGARTFSTLAAGRQLVAGYTPDQIATAYNINPLYTRGIDGSGETIALLELDSFAPSDIQQFDAATQLPDASIQTYYVGGGPFRLHNAGEATLDIEWAHALAPGANIQVYYLPSQQANAAGWRSVASAVNTAVSNGANVISLSFGGCQASSGYSVAQQAFAQALARGVNVFVSSGDTGALPGPVKECGKQYGVGYPASDPSVVSVGGTSLQLNADNSIYQETGWSLSGGGKGNPLPRPVWQVATSLHPGRYRYAPDVAFLGDPATGAGVVWGGSWHRVGGTSLGSPAWAAIWTLVQSNARQAGKTTGAAPSLFYRIGNSSARTRAFQDITAGYNGKYNAHVGWDAVTGWGTPNVAGLASAILALA